MFSCELCRIFKNKFFEEHLRMAASELEGGEDLRPIYQNRKILTWYEIEICNIHAS